MKNRSVLMMLGFATLFMVSLSDAAGQDKKPKPEEPRIQTLVLTPENNAGGEKVIVYISPDGTYSINNSSVDLGRLGKLLSSLKGKQIPIQVQPVKECPYEHVYNVLLLIQKEGLSHLHMAPPLPQQKEKE